MGGLGGVKVGFCVGDGRGVGDVTGVTVGDGTEVGVGDGTGVTVGDRTGVGDGRGVTVGNLTGVGVGDGTGVCKTETFCTDKVGLEEEGNGSKCVDNVDGLGPVHKK